MERLAAHRDHVIEQLSTGFSVDRIEVEELERRIALAHAADSRAALDALVTDLVPSRGLGSLAGSPGLAPSSALAFASESQALVPAKRFRVVFGSIERVGAWAVPSHLKARVLFGNILLDLRDAQLAPVTTIDVHVTMGNVEILVPPGVAVEMDATPVLGNVEDRTEPGIATTHLVRITGRVKLGNVEAWTLMRGETKRDARWRRRRERRERRQAQWMAHHERQLAMWSERGYLSSRSVE